MSLSPSLVPELDDPSQVERLGDLLRGGAGEVAEVIGTVARRQAGLSQTFVFAGSGIAHYLFDPDVRRSESLADDAAAVASALRTYANELAVLHVKRSEVLWLIAAANAACSAATAMMAEVGAAGSEGYEARRADAQAASTAASSRAAAARTAAAALVEALERAELACVNAINRRAGVRPIYAGRHDYRHTPYEAPRPVFPPEPVTPRTVNFAGWGASFAASTVDVRAFPHSSFHFVDTPSLYRSGASVVFGEGVDAETGRATSDGASPFGGGVPMVPVVPVLPRSSSVPKAPASTPAVPGVPSAPPVPSAPSVPSTPPVEPAPMERAPVAPPKHEPVPVEPQPEQPGTPGVPGSEPTSPGEPPAGEGPTDPSPPTGTEPPVGSDPGEAPQPPPETEPPVGSEYPEPGNEIEFPAPGSPDWEETPVDSEGLPVTAPVMQPVEGPKDTAVRPPPAPVSDSTAADDPADEGDVGYADLWMRELPEYAGVGG